jgi:hypothetical protein
MTRVLQDVDRKNDIAEGSQQWDERLEIRMNVFEHLLVHNIRVGEGLTFVGTDRMPVNHIVNPVSKWMIVIVVI